MTPFLIWGQNTSVNSFSISGKVIDVNTLEPLEYATVVFKKPESEDLAFGAVTNHKGNFSVKVEKGSYEVTITFISYKSKTINLSTVERNYDLGNIVLELDTEFLSEIVIVGEQKQLEIKPNKMVFNVAKDLTSSGNMIGDVLNNIPSVSVDPDGNVSLMGQQNVAILIDNKVSSLTRSNGLSAIPASSIERIEVITNPGAAYKASSIGVINIILKKGKDQGLNASLTATSGYKDSHGTLVTFNHKSETVDFYTNTSYFMRNPVELVSSENSYFLQGSPIGHLMESSRNDNDGNGLYSTIGIGLQLSDHTRISTNFNYQRINNEVTNTTQSELFNGNLQPVGTNNRSFLSDFDDEILEFQFNFDHAFSRKGQELKSYLTHSEDAEQYKNTVYNSSGGFTDESYQEKNTIKNTIFDIQYSSPINENSSFVLGYNAEFGKIPFQYSGTENLRIDYQRNVQAAFLDYDMQLNKFYYSLGIRTEFSKTELNYSNTGSGYQENRTDWFPSAYLEFTLSDKSSLNMSYGRKIIEPGYYQLNPVEQRFSETNLYRGNESLRPVFVDMSNLAFTYYSTNFTFTPNLFFNKYHDYWQEITYTTGDFITNIPKMVTTPVNLGTVNYYGVNLTGVNKLSKSITVTSNALLYYFDQKGVFNGFNNNLQSITRDYENTSFSGTLSLMTQFRFQRLFNFQTTIKHELESKGAYSERKAFTYLNLALTKDILANNGTLSLSSNDLFNSYRTDRHRFDPDFKANRLIDKEFRTILVSFTYRFNQSKKNRDIDFDKKVNNLRY